jgi:hypothetical protein
MNTLLKGIISHLPGIHAMDRHLWRRYTGQKGPEIYPPGHFHPPAQSRICQIKGDSALVERCRSHSKPTAEA